MTDFAQRGPVEMLFVPDLWSGSVGVLLCEMEMVLQGSQTTLQPVRVAKPLEFDEIKNDGIGLPPTFRLHRRRLQQLADELAKIGVYPSRLPEVAEAQTKAHLDDLRHSRDYLEGQMTKTLETVNRMID